MGARGAARLRPYLFTAPAMAVFVLFFLYPIGYMIYLSTTSWNMINPVKEFVGLENYQELLADPDFLQVMNNTLVYTVLSVLIALALALVLALWLNRRGWVYSMMQGAIFSPYIISLVSVSLLWLWLMDPQYGLLNWMLGLIGLPPSRWLTHNDTAIYALVLVSVWKMVGYNTLVCIAGLQSIPKELHEAAQLDRASVWSEFWRITLPMISPTLFFLLVVNTISSFQVFDTVKIMTQGGPVNSTNMLVYYIFEYGFEFFKIGYASAAGVVLFVLIGLMTVLHFLILSRRVHYR